MTKLIVAATAVAITLLAGAARPDEAKTVAIGTRAAMTDAIMTGAVNMREGVVARVNPAAGSLILADGQSYRMADPALLFGYGRGDAVMVGYDMEQGQKVARSLYRVPLSGSY